MKSVWEKNAFSFFQFLSVCLLIDGSKSTRRPAPADLIKHNSFAWTKKSLPLEQRKVFNLFGEDRAGK